MLAHQGAGVFAARCQRRLQLGRCGRIGHMQRIAQCHGNVAQPALVTDAPDRAALGKAHKFVLRPGKQVGQPVVCQTGAWVKVRQRAALGKLVPRANQLAVVTAIDAVAQQRAQFQRDRPRVLNGQVADATARVQPVRGHDGLRRADVDARAAPAAMSFYGCAGGQRLIDKNFTQKKHRPRRAVQRQRVLATPAQTAARGQFHFKHRG